MGLLWTTIGKAQTIDQDSSQQTVTIDTVIIKRNWMTWDRIIKNELRLKRGAQVKYSTLEKAVQRVWNIGNFTKVDHRIETKNERSALIVEAFDAVKLFPLMSLDHSSEEEYRYLIGFVDDNFLGSNSKLRVAWDKQPVGATWNIRFNLPRQLLYKNMQLGVGVSFGDELRRNLYREITYTEEGDVEGVTYQPDMLAPYHKLEVTASIGNPWHLDYSYRFSPDLDVQYRYYGSDESLMQDTHWNQEVLLAPFEHRMLALTFRESIGLVNAQRHRLNGYQLEGSIEWAIGLTETSPTYQSINLTAEYHKIFNPTIQFSSWVRTGLTNAPQPYQFIKGAEDVIGLRLGEIYGRTYYSAYTGVHFTWFNRDWLAVENAYFVNWGNGAADYQELFTASQKVAVGSSFLFQVPFAPFLFAKLTFMYAGPGTEWFKIKT
ncbi:hypothetical protein GCM10023331_32410 [Algivirga pacifica]|uniref:POTRA domain-containing protein n=2 Tax=Algivirga pacifica TaxID=1162670 RepID=A0ABP9DGS7_9BACT